MHFILNETSSCKYKLPSRKTIRHWKYIFLCIDHALALEEAIEMFLKASTSPVSWDMFVSKVETVERTTAIKMRKRLGLANTPGIYNYYLFQLGCLSEGQSMIIIA